MTDDISIRDVSRATQERNPGLFLAPDLPGTAPHEHHTGRESDLQEACESFLERQGFYRRNNKGLDAGPSARGWFDHRPSGKDRGLFYMLDLEVHQWSPVTSWHMFELKTATGRVRQRQQQILNQCPNASLCRGYAEFKAAYWEWQASKGGDQ